MPQEAKKTANEHEIQYSTKEHFITSAKTASQISNSGGKAMTGKRLKRLTSLLVSSQLGTGGADANTGT